MEIRGSTSIRGLLDLPSISQQIKAGQVVSIRDNEYYNNDVQTALRMGLLDPSDPSKISSNSKECDNTNSSVTFVNTCGRSITIDGIIKDVQPKHTFVLTESQMELPSVRAALMRGYISLHEKSTETGASVEKIVEIGSLSKKTSSEVALTNLIQRNTRKHSSKKTAIDTFDESETEEVLDPGLSPVQASLLAASNKAQTKRRQTRILETNEEATLSKVIDSDNPAEVKAEDSRQNTIIWNPTSSNPVKAIKDITSLEKDRESGLGQTAKSDTLPADQVEVFVDEEMEKERTRKHPMLGKKPPSQHEEIIMVEDPDEAKRKKHPILGKQD